MNDKNKKSETKPKYPKLSVNLADVGGNTASLMAKVELALASIGVEQKERNTFLNASFQDAFDSVVETAGKWVTIKGKQ